MRRLAVAIAVPALGVSAPAAGAVTPEEVRAIAERAIAAGPDAGPFDHHRAFMPAQRTGTYSSQTNTWSPATEQRSERRRDRDGRAVRLPGAVARRAPARRRSAQGTCPAP